MTLGSFTMGTDAFLISGVLPSVGEHLGVSVGTAGLLITVFAAVYAVAGPFLAVATGTIDRRRVLTGALFGFVVANVLAAAAPNYAIMMISRVLAALAAALFMPAASASAATIVAPEERGRALTAILGGLTIASALGVPLGTLIAGFSNWRAAFVFVAVLSLAALLGLVRALPAVPSSGVASLSQRAKAAVLPRVPTILLGSLLTFAGMFALYAYLAWLANEIGGISGSAVTWVYLAYGLCGVISNFAAGWLIDHYPPQRIALISSTILIVVMGLFVVLAAYGSSGASTIVWLLALLVVWSLVGWTVNPSQQKRLVDAGGPHAQTVLSLSGSAVYAGQAIGSLVGGLVLSHGAVPLTLTALGLQVLTVLVMFVSAINRKPPAKIPQAPIVAEKTGPTAN